MSMTVDKVNEPGTEVRRGKRSWPASFKLRILKEVDEAKASGGSGAVGEILRREGLYSSLLTDWRRQRDEGALVGLADTRQGRKPKDPVRAENERLRVRVEALESELVTANELIEAQGKVSALWAERSSRSAETSIE